MHVHWGWIKQRPQFIAENLSLSGEYQVSVFCESSYKKEKLTNKKLNSALEVHELSRLPFGRFRLIRWINSIFYKKQLKKSFAKADVIWITYPYLYEWIAGMKLNNAKLIYDCMDDALEAPNIKDNALVRNNLFLLEKKIVKRANVIFASSDNLKRKLIQRYALNSDAIHVINNALSIPNCIKKTDYSNNFLMLKKELLNVQLKKIMYLGTIGKWIDFDLIHQSLALFPDIVYVFIGPKENNPIAHERLLFFPPITHHEVFDAMALADALIMPFVVSEFILGVNPVKVYEYIHSTKPAIVVAYPETDKFSDYVNLYRNKEEFFDFISCLVSNKLEMKASAERSSAYIHQNTWMSRSKFILDVLKETLQKSPNCVLVVSPR